MYLKIFSQWRIMAESFWRWLLDIRNEKLSWLSKKVSA